MVKTLRPSRQAFEDAGWLPRSEEAFQKYIAHLDKHTSYALYSPAAPGLLPAVEKFKKFVEDNAVVRMDFERMFEDAKEEVSIVYLSCSSLRFLSFNVF